MVLEQLKGYLRRHNPQEGENSESKVNSYVLPEHVDGMLPSQTQEGVEYVETRTLGLHFFVFLV
jgi:hypothetical protein